jgi:hypothetical protein
MRSEVLTDTNQPSYERRKGVAHRAGVAVRPTILFVTGFALNATPHEAVHAATAYMLGFSSLAVPENLGFGDDGTLREQSTVDNVRDDCQGCYSSRHS